METWRWRREGGAGKYHAYEPWRPCEPRAVRHERRCGLAVDTGSMTMPNGDEYCLTCWRKMLSV